MSAPRLLLLDNVDSFTFMLVDYLRTAGADVDILVDLNFNFNMAFETCSDGKPGFRNNFQSVQILTREAGAVCGGTSGPATVTTWTTSSMRSGLGRLFTISVSVHGLVSLRCA